MNSAQVQIVEIFHNRKRHCRFVFNWINKNTFKKCVSLYNACYNPLNGLSRSRSLPYKYIFLCCSSLHTPWRVARSSYWICTLQWFFYLISSRYALKSEFVHGMTLLQNEIIVDTILHPRLGVVNLLRVKGSNFFISL